MEKYKLMKVPNIDWEERKKMIIKEELSGERKKKLATSVDLSTNFNYIYDQGSLNSCVANSVAWAFRYFKQGFNPSRLFIYYNSRWIDQQDGYGSVKKDEGTYVISGFKSVKRYGVCGGSIWPYQNRKFAIKPRHICYRRGKKHMLIQYSYVPQTLDFMRFYLNEGYPFVIALLIYSSFYTSVGGVIPYPDTSSDVLVGAHSLVIVGYDDTTQLFKFVNSWSRSYGDDGYGYLPYNYITNPGLVFEIYVMLKTKNKKRL